MVFGIQPRDMRKKSRESCHTFIILNFVEIKMIHNLILTFWNFLDEHQIFVFLPTPYVLSNRRYLTIIRNSFATIIISSIKLSYRNMVCKHKNSLSDKFKFLTKCKPFPIGPNTLQSTYYHMHITLRHFISFCCCRFPPTAFGISNGK